MSKYYDTQRAELIQIIWAEGETTKVLGAYYKIYPTGINENGKLEEPRTPKLKVLIINLTRVLYQTHAVVFLKI